MTHICSSAHPFKYCSNDKSSFEHFLPSVIEHLKCMSIVDACSEKADSQNQSIQAVFQVGRSRCKDVKDHAGLSFPATRLVSFLKCLIIIIIIITIITIINVIIIIIMINIIVSIIIIDDISEVHRRRVFKGRED